MKLFISFFLLALFSFSSYSQKSPLNFDALTRWTHVASPQISNNGQYAAYSIVNEPPGSFTLVVKAINPGWMRTFARVREGFFSGNSSQFVFRRADTLFFLKLGTDSLTFIPRVKAYKKSGGGKVEWLAYDCADSGGDAKLILLNLVSGKKASLGSVSDYIFDQSGRALLLKESSSRNDTVFTTLRWMSLESDSSVIVCQDQLNKGSGEVSSFRFDPEGRQLCFIVSDGKAGERVNNLWYCKWGSGHARKLGDNHSLGLQQDVLIQNWSLQFSPGGDGVLFKLEKDGTDEDSKKKSKQVSIDIWNYRDKVIQPSQSKVRPTRAFDGWVSLLDGRSLLLTQPGEKIVSMGKDYALIQKNCRDSGYWWQNFNCPFFLLSFKTGERLLLRAPGQHGGLNYSFSPHQRFLVYFDPVMKAYFSYNIATGRTIDISKNIPESVINEYLLEDGRTFPVGSGGWMESDDAVLIYGNYDIWKVDPQGKLKPICITGHVGVQRHIKFRFVYSSNEYKGFESDEEVLLSAFSPDNKDNGYCKIRLGNPNRPNILTIGPYFWSILDSQIPGGIPGLVTMFPVKARDANVWIVGRMSEVEAPNYFVTRDFIEYEPISELHPQSSYNWLATELFKWKQLDGTWSQGILYKPQDFDSTKKYPIIFTYYEKVSFSLHAFLNPELASGPIDVPWFVSHGYLVFMPDIYYSIASRSGKTTGWNAYNSIYSAALFLSRKPWINAKRMGITGHSFGGSQTNHVLVRTKLFAAAVEAAGGSDAVSSYLDGQYVDRQNGTEVGQGRVGATLWERPELYLDNSVVIKADRVTTPLLIMHNKADAAVPWVQATEMFMALRRLGKKVWLLQYDGQGHVLTDEGAMKDYTIRMMQFFDHYLKDLPAPKWMTQGIPAYRKGIDSGLELDSRDSLP